MNHGSHPSWTAILLAEVQDYRREMDWSRDAFAQEVVKRWQSLGEPHIGKVWKTGGDIYECGRVNGQRLFRWFDEVTSDNGLLPANVVPAVLLALPEHRRIRVLNAQLQSMGLMVEHIPSADDATAVNDLVASSIKECAEAQQALLTIAQSPTEERLHAARKETVEAMTATASALSFIDKLLARRPS